MTDRRKTCPSLLALVEAQRAMLMELEWMSNEFGARGNYCPRCGRHVTEGHNAVCSLAALLAQPTGGEK